MTLNIKHISNLKPNKSLVVIVSSVKDLESLKLSENEQIYVKKSLHNKQNLITVNQYSRMLFIQLIPEKKSGTELLEALRREASQIKSILNKTDIRDLVLMDFENSTERLLAYAEGIALSHYQFVKYFTDKEKKENKLKELSIFSPEIKAKQIEELKVIVDSVGIARDLVNEPLSYLNTKTLCEEVSGIAHKSGFAIEILRKKQIQSLKMGGLLAVNQGSNSEPAFMILSWKPENAKNKSPLILVGKGIVYDTGGLSLKPTPDSMDYMKSDMAGAAAVAAILSAISQLKLPVWVEGLIPATDNAIGNNAYVPGDVIRMHNKKTVEVLNTDAEGRLILADALSYAAKYKPALVIDIATLTGAAAMAFGHYAIALMGKAPEKVFNSLEESSKRTSERMVRLPLYDDFMELLKSDVADIKNIGGRIAGAMTAGKFLEFFTDFPWIHLDIAGTGWVNKDVHYLTKGGTGSSIRLLVDFVKNYK